MNWLSFADFNAQVAARSKYLDLEALDRAIEIVQEEVEHTDDQYKYALYCVYIALIR